MLPDSLYVQTVTKIETGTTSTNQIDNFFKVPESGTIEFYRDEKGNVFGTLKGERNTYTKNFLSPNFINNANWKKIVEDADGSVLLTNNITGPGTATFKSLVGGTDTTTPLLKLTTVSGKITADSTNLTDNSANLLQFGGSSVRDDAYYTIGDKKFKSSKIISSGRPVWEDANGVSYPWLTTQDIRNGWNFRGDLYSGGTFVDLNTLNVIPYEVIMSKTFLHQFGLDYSDSVDKIANDPLFFTRKLLRKRNPLITNQNYFDIELKSPDGQHKYILDRRKLPDTSNFEELEIRKQYDDNGVLWRLDFSNKKMYKLYDKNDKVFKEIKK